MIKARQNKKDTSLWKTIAKSVKSLNQRYDKNEKVPLNIKKVRGWKRRVADLHEWGEYIFNPDLRFWNSGYDFLYEQYKVMPWYTFYGTRRPPLWFLIELVNQLGKAYDNWEKTLKEAGEPYDLRLEVHDPDYILSALECKRTKQFGEEVYYWPIAEQQRKFPYNKFKSTKIDLSKFTWILCEEEDSVFESEIYWRSTTKEKLLESGYAETKTDKGDVLFTKKTGDVWVGRKGATENNQKTIIRQYPIPPPG